MKFASEIVDGIGGCIRSVRAIPGGDVVSAATSGFGTSTAACGASTGAGVVGLAMSKVSGEGGDAGTGEAAREAMA